MRTVACIAMALALSSPSLASVYYVNARGSDAFGDGSVSSPWKTLEYATTKVSPNQGHTIKIGPGVFIVNNQIAVPAGVSIEGAGINATIFKVAASFYYHPSSDPGYSTDKFLFSLSEDSPRDGNQTLRNFAIDGDSKQLHGGIYVRYRNNMVIDEVKVQNTNYCGIWLWDVKDSQLTNTQLVNCSWGSSGYSSGALNLGNLERVEISRLNVDENTGYGVKALGPDGYNDIFYLKIHDCHISVAPDGLWDNGTSPNLSIELWLSTLVGCEIYNNYVDNTISLVNSAVPSTGVQTIRVHDNIFDLETRAKGSGYGIELTLHDAEIDHNYFIKGNYGIANWDNPMQNWSIHHNVFYALEEETVGEIVRSQWSGLHHVKLYNNTIEFTGNQTMNVIGLYGGTSDNLDIKNNQIINSNTGYTQYPNQLIHTENGATITTGTLQLLNNSTTGLDPGDLLSSILGLPIPNPLINLTVLPNPSITKNGNRPYPYYKPVAGSSLINTGLKVGFLYGGSAPDIGAYEFDSVARPNQPPFVSFTTPANHADYPSSSSVALAVNVSDPDGTIAKIEFFNGSTKLGETTVSPYQFIWINPPSGKIMLSAKATDNQNATTTSPPIAITITSGSLIDSDATGIKFGLFASDATLTGSMTLFDDKTATKGSYFSVPPGVGKNDSLPPPAEATFNFRLPISDDYEIWARVQSASEGNQEYFVNSGTANWTIWRAGVHPAWSWVNISDSSTGQPILYSLQEGFNTFTMGWRDENVRIDRIILTNDRTFDPSSEGEGQSLKIYPNPTAGEFTVECFSNFFQQAEIRIYDVAGKLTRRSLTNVTIGINKIPVDVSDLSSNLYIVSLVIDGSKPHSGKVVVIH